MYKSWYSYTEYLEKKYGQKLYRVGVDGGFSCPNREKNKSGGCTFCDGTGSAASYQRKSESAFNRSSSYNKVVAQTVIERYASIEDQINKGLEFIKRRYKAELAALYFQSFTNTYDSPENLKTIYDRALNLYPWREFIVSTRPDTIPEETLELLESYILPDRDVWLELGLQSSNDETLKRINRGHDSFTFLDAVKRAKSHHLLISAHIILGLPGENREDYIKTVKFLNKTGVDAVKIHNLHITGGTKLEEEFLDGEVVSSSSLRHLEDTELALRYLNPNIVVERLTCDTPPHRLLEPRHFMDKSLFLRTLDERMQNKGVCQGDLL